MANHRPTATERTFAISAFRNGMAVAAIARRIGKKPGSVTWLLRRAGLKGDPHGRPIDPEAMTPHMIPRGRFAGPILRSSGQCGAPPQKDKSIRQ
jgi:hypothetical protein